MCLSKLIGQAGSSAQPDFRSGAADSCLNAKTDLKVLRQLRVKKGELLIVVIKLFRLRSRLFRIVYADLATLNEVHHFRP